MSRPSFRPLALLVCALFGALSVSRADEPSPDNVGGWDAPLDALQTLALEPVPQLRVETRFNQLAEARHKEHLIKKTATKKPGPGFTYLKFEPLPVASADSSNTYPLFLIADQIEGRGDVVLDATGSAELRKTDLLLFADRIQYFPLDDELNATGKVKMLQDGAEIDTPHLNMRMADQIGYAETANYHVIRETSSILYAKKRRVSVQSTSVNGQAVSGTPMMLNVPTSYGLSEAPPLKATDAYGYADRIDFEGENRIRMTQGTYSSCKPDSQTWYIKGREILLDYDAEQGEAKAASLWFDDVPIFYVPTGTFSLNQNRRSGFLHPYYSLSTKSGLDLTVPYYWNVAPDYDFTFYPRYMSKRGTQLGVESRYLEHNYQGYARVEYMPNDQQAGLERYAYQLKHVQDLGAGLTAAVNLNGVSDDYYWQDLSSRLLSTGSLQQERRASLGYSPAPWLQANAQVLQYQTLQDAVRPYFLEPQLNLFGYKADVGVTDFTMQGQFSRFTHPDKVQGDRVVFYPQLSLPLLQPAFQITPKIGMHMTKYQLDWRGESGNDQITRTLPILSIDANMVFERDTRVLDRDYIQTLEPRLYYVRIPYKNQTNIPVFDSGLSDFNFAQIFSENRYSGYDRINDANQLTAGVTTKFLDAVSGSENFKAMIGQRFYFDTQRTILDSTETTRNKNFSNIIVGATGLIAAKTYLDFAWEYDHREGQSQRFSGGARYQPDFGHVLSASYRYAKDPLTDTTEVDQFDLAAQWPIAARWYGVGRYNYSVKDNRPLEIIAGLEYNAGCWATRVVAQRLEAIAGSPNTTLYFQLELMDLGSIGTNPVQLLRRTVPGYGKINELSDPSGSLLTTR